MVIEQSINRNADHVFEYLSDMQKFVSVHPIIYRIDDLGKGHYKVFEKLKVLFIPFRFTYPVTIEKNIPERRVTIRAQVKKIIRIQMELSLVETAGKTRISETVTFRSALPVHFIMNRIFRQQHKQLFLNIEKA
jgi:carbon monoxide dehydrogenase subunit G